MYNVISAAIGILVALMVTSNGILSKGVGNNWATIIIHVSGFIGISLILIVKKKRIYAPKGISIALYSAGAIGVFNVLFTNLAFGYLGASITFALSLLGQSIASIVIDHFGLFELKQLKLNKMKIIGVMIITVGIVIMMMG